MKGIGKMEKVDRNVKKKKEEKIVETSQEETKEEKIQNKEEIKTEIKKEEKPKKVKKTEAVVRGVGTPISSKQSFAICKFIKHKEINKAINELEEILLHKRALPMKGEIPHRKGAIMSGRYPKNAIEEFIKLLKSLNSNAIANEISNPVISEAFGNFASRPYGRFGRVRKKRTNIKIVAKEKVSSKHIHNKENKMEKKK